MNRIELRRLSSNVAFEEFRNAIEENNEEKVIDMLEELLNRGVYLRGIMDCLFAKVECGRLKSGERMTNIIAHTILHCTRTAVLMKPDTPSALFNKTQDLRAFARILSNDDSSNAISWYKDRFIESHQSSR